MKRAITEADYDAPARDRRGRQQHERREEARLAHLAGTLEERARVLRLLRHMVYNPAVFGERGTDAIYAAIEDLRRRVLDEREGVPPFAVHAGVLSESGELSQPGGPVRGVNGAVERSLDGGETWAHYANVDTPPHLSGFSCHSDRNSPESARPA